MPLYEYECQNGHRFEKIQKFSDPKVTVCPTCGAPVEKLMSSPAIQFKGSGFYITDYPKKDSGVSAGKNSESGEGSAKDAPAKEGSSTGSGSDKSTSAPAPSTSPTPSTSTATSTPSTPSTTKSTT
jgi:putative FmdB family regulatory protein